MAVGQFFKRSHGRIAGQGLGHTVTDSPRFFRQIASCARNQTQGQPGLKLSQISLIHKFLEGLEEFRFAHV